MKSILNTGEQMYSFHIKPKKDAQPIGDLEFCAMSCRVTENHARFPLPWDAAVDIVNNHLEIEGSCFPCGMDGSIATVRIHLSTWAGLGPKPVVISATGPWETFNELRRRGWEVTQ